LRGWAGVFLSVQMEHAPKATAARWSEASETMDGEASRGENPTAIYVSQNSGHGQADKRSREGIASRIMCQSALNPSESHLTLISFRDAGTARLHDKGKA
jgi:hypothetical protein